MAEKRIEYIDAIKGLAIWMVVFCHYTIGVKDSSVFQNVLMTLCWAAVPCFFMTSGGLLLNSSKFNFKKWRTKLIKLIAVLISWRIIYFALGEIILRRSYGPADLLGYIFINRDLPGLDTEFMWFMVAFISVQLLYPVLWHIWHNEENGMKLSALITVLAYIPCVGIHSLNFIFERISFHFDKALIDFWDFNEYFLFQQYSNMLMYFMIGGFLFKYREEIKEKITGPWKVIAPVCMLACGTFGLMVIKHAVVGDFTWSSTYIPDGYNWTSTLVLSLGMYLLIYLNNIPGFNALGKIVGQHTMGIYYMHYIILILLDYYVLRRLDDIIPFDYGLNTIKTVIILAVCIVLTIGIRKIPVVKNMVE